MSFNIFLCIHLIFLFTMHNIYLRFNTLKSMLYILQSAFKINQQYKTHKILYISTLQFNLHIKLNILLNNINHIQYTLLNF